MEISLSERLSGIGEYYFSQKLREIEQLRKSGKDIINLGIGSPDLPPHPSVVNVLAEQAAKPTVHGYQGYKGVPALRNAIATWYADWYDVALDPESEVLPLIGSKEGIMHICMTYLQHGDIALVPNPGYPTYSSAVKLAGGVCRDYALNETNHWHPDVEALRKSDLGRVKLMFLNYPHMPTGQAPNRDALSALIELAREKGILLVHDNPYSFILNDNPWSLLSLPGAKEVCIELNSLSKSHNMAGWRVGMLLGKKQRIDEVLTFKSNMDSGMFLPLQLAAAQALTLGKEWHDGLNKIYRERREKVFALLNLLHCEYREGQTGMFVWAKTPADVKDGFALSDKVLYDKSVFITPGGIFGSEGNGFVRISLCGSLERFEEAIQRIGS